MAYESFYGGRQGASFVIVKKYTSISNMLDDFEGGGITTKEVNYGEYVLIDDLEHRSNIELGCVYRRGMNITDRVTPPPYPQPGESQEAYKEWMKNPGCGAEYIGQIRGASGSIRGLELNNYDSSASTGEYTPAEIVTGKENNGIKYSQQNVEDAYGDVQNCKIGFQFPYFQQDWEMESVDPYDGQSGLIDRTRKDDSLPYSDDNKASWSERPFYRDYLLSIPKGVKGDSVKCVYIFPKKLRIGTQTYGGIDSQKSLYNPKEVIDANNASITVLNYNVTSQDNYVQWTDTVSGETRYAYLIENNNLENGEEQYLGYVLTNYETSAEGVDSWKDGTRTEINHILAMAVNHVNKDEDHLLVYYSDTKRRNPLITYNGITGWVDLGNIKGRPGGVSVWTTVTSLNDLQPGVPPELMPGGENYRGWVVAYDDDPLVENNPKPIYYYDYKDNVWRYGGVLSGGGSGSGIIISETQPIDAISGDVQGKVETIRCFP